MKKFLRIVLLFFSISCSENNANRIKISSGEKIYSNNCISCHDSGMLPNLTFNKLELSQIISIVKYGRYGGIMPSFEGVLSAEEIEDVSYYIFNLY